MTAATRLFVGNLPGNTDEKDLQSAFSAFGDIETVDLKSKTENEDKKFAFVSLSASPLGVESCINHFSTTDFKGSKLYVTRARESFLERLQRERSQAQLLEAEKASIPKKLPKKNPVIKLSEKLNPKKRKIDSFDTKDSPTKLRKHVKKGNVKEYTLQSQSAAHDLGRNKNLLSDDDKKKHEAEKKRMESLKRKRQEFKEKQMIIKTGLTDVDKIKNKKLIFNDNDDATMVATKPDRKMKGDGRKKLFDHDDDDSETELNFEVKQYFEGKSGQKVLDLQSRYKSDKRFTLDERFLEEEEGRIEPEEDNEEVEVGHADEKAKQLNILQDVLGVTIRTKSTDVDNKKTKPKLGMLRFDPMQPDHAKFLAPVETKPEPVKKSKKKMKEIEEDIKETQPEPEIPKVEVSKEQFYKVSETLKESIAQPTTFSLRSLFGNNENDDNGPGSQEQDTDYISLEIPKAKKKVKNPLDPTEKNPFVYDSSDSETEELEKEVQKIEPPPAMEPVAVWKENLFFSKSDPRLKDGLDFFTKASENEVLKERRELKSLVKKRIYNKERKNQMFKKKIGGRKKSMKKPYKMN